MEAIPDDVAPVAQVLRGLLTDANFLAGLGQQLTQDRSGHVVPDIIEDDTVFYAMSCGQKKSLIR